MVYTDWVWRMQIDVRKKYCFSEKTMSNSKGNFLYSFEYTVYLIYLLLYVNSFHNLDISIWITHCHVSSYYIEFIVHSFCFVGYAINEQICKLFI